MKNIKKILILFLSISFLLSGCSSEKKKAYENAIELAENGSFPEAVSELSKNPDYKDSADKIIEYKYSYANIIINNEKSSNEDVKTAVEYLKEISEYEDSEQLLIKGEKMMNYNEALAHFSAGEFDEALKLFNELKNDYDDCDRYIAAIDVCQKMQGSWSGSDVLPWDNYWGSQIIDIECSIGAPYTLREKSLMFSDCDWAVSLSVSIDVELINKIGISDFTINEVVSTEIPHDEDDEENYLEPSIWINGYDAYDNKIFKSERGYSKGINLKYKEYSDKIELTELLGNLTGSTSYGANSITLER